MATLSGGNLPEEERTQAPEQIFEGRPHSKEGIEIPESKGETARKAAKITLARIDNYRDLWAETLQEGDEKFKQKTRELWGEFAIHGIFGVDKKTGEKTILNSTDLDGKSSLGLLNLAGINTDDVKYIAPSEFIPGRINLDTGDRHGLIVEDKGKTAFFDHHADDSGSTTSATKITYETLVGLGLLEKSEQLDRLVEFVTQVDNRSFPEEEKYFRDSWKNLLGLQRFIQFKHLLDFFKAGRNPTEILTDEDLKNFNLEKSSKEQMGVVDSSIKELKRMEGEGLIVPSERYGRIAVDIGKKVPAGFDAAKAYGCGGYIIWNPQENSFFICMLRPLVDKFKQGRGVRDTMWIKPRHDPTPLTLTLKEILEKLTDDKLQISGKLKEYLEEGGSLPEEEPRVEKTEGEGPQPPTEPTPEQTPPIEEPRVEWGGKVGLEPPSMPSVPSVPGVPQPPAPPSPLIPPAPPTPPEVPGAEISEAEATQRARGEVARIKKEIRRELTPDEQEIIFAKYLGERVNRLDRKTAELYGKYGKLTRSSKLKNFLTAVRDSAATIAAGIILRTGLKAIAPGFAFPGAVVGGVLGGLLGARRGYQAKERELLGAKGWYEEYQRIKEEARDPEARENALAFLENVLETPHNFKGKQAELLRILSFYRQEAAQRIQETQPEKVTRAEQEAGTDVIKIGNERLKIDEQTIEAFFNNLGEKKETAQVLVNNYRTGRETRRALRNAAIKGGLLGAGIGLGVGAAADALAHWLAGVKEEKIQEAIIRGTGGKEWHYANEYTLSDVAPRPEESAHNLKEATDYGNALSHAVKEGVGENCLQLPSDATPEQYQGLLHSLNFAQGPEQLPGHYVIDPTTGNYLTDPAGHYVIEGGHYDFNQRELQGFINMAFQESSPNKYYELIRGADEALASIRTGIEQTAQAAAGAVAEAAPGVGVPPIWPGVITGVGAAAGGEAAGGKMSGVAGAIKPARPEEAVPVAGAGRPEAPPEQPQQQAPAPEGRAPTEPQKPAEPRPPEARPETAPQAVDWAGIDNIATLNQRANETLSELQTKSWEKLDETGKNNLDGLFNFLKGARDYTVVVKKGAKELGLLMGYKESEKTFGTRDKKGNLETIQLTSPESMQNVTIKIEPPKKKR